MIAGLIIKKMMKEGYEAFNQNNFAKVVSSYRDDATLIFPGEVPGSGTFTGKAAIEGWFRQWFDQFPSTHFDIKDIYVKSIFGFRTNTVAVHWDIQVTNRYGRAGKDSGVSVIEIKGGTALRSTDFIFDQGDNFKSLWETV